MIIQKICVRYNLDENEDDNENDDDDENDDEDDNYPPPPLRSSHLSQGDKVEITMTRTKTLNSKP